MKKTIVLICLLSLVVCGFSSAQTPQVHVAGWDYGNAAYWLNGKQTLLPKTGYSATASGIALSGSNVYISGWDTLNDGQYAVYWLNGQRTALPKSGTNATAMAITVSGSNVYIVGDDDDYAVYWLNGRRTALPKTGARATANAVKIFGSNIYIAGKDGSNAVLWVDGQRTVLPSNSGDAEANSVEVFEVAGKKWVYIAGRDGKNAVNWIDGKLSVLKSLDIETGPAEATSIIAVHPPFVVTAGYIDKFDGEDSPIAAYWSSMLIGEIRILSNSTLLDNFRANASAINTSRKMFIAGRYGSDAVYWPEDDPPIILPKTGKRATANAIAVR